MAKEPIKGIESKVEKLEDIIKSLNTFSKASLKPAQAHDEDGKISKMVAKAQVDALELKHAVEDIKRSLEAIKPAKHSRFAGRIVAKYLESL